MGRRYRLVILLTSAVLVPIATDLAASTMPIEIRRHRWVPWIAVAFLLLPLIWRELHGSERPAEDGYSEGPIRFRLSGPEDAARESETLYGDRRFREAFSWSVVAVDRLHDFYVFDQFKNRQPSLNDAWIMNGLVNSLGVTISMDRSVQIQSELDTARHRLQDIIGVCTQSGFDPTIYKNALRQVDYEASTLQ